MDQVDPDPDSDPDPQHWWEPHQFSFFGGVGSWAGCVLASKAIELDRERLRNLRGETETEFVRNSRRFRGSNMNPKKSHVYAEASASIQASI